MVTRTSQERFRTDKGVFDAFTNRNLFELKSRGYFDELISPIFVGKESNVFSAIRKGKKVIIKIYRVQNCDFKRMFQYIKQDPRYDFLRNRRREIIFSWTQREYKNLIKAERGKVNVPKTIAVKNNILIEEFIGDSQPAPPLKDSYPDNPQKFFDDIVKEMKKMYNIGLVHGDLSSFNILNFNEKPVLIDFSQATLVKTPNSEELLERDVNNIVKFFKKLGVKAEIAEIMEKIRKF
jgi:RIO kinase 1